MNYWKIEFNAWHARDPDPYSFRYDFVVESEEAPTEKQIRKHFKGSDLIIDTKYGIEIHSISKLVLKQNNICCAPAQDTCQVDPFASRWRIEGPAAQAKLPRRFGAGPRGVVMHPDFDEHYVIENS